MLITQQKKSGRHFISQCTFLKKKIIQKVYLYFLSGADSRIWGCMLGSIQGGTDNFVRPGKKESGKICKSYKRLELENAGTA